MLGSQEMKIKVFLATCSLLLASTLSTAVNADLIGLWHMDGNVNDATSNGIDGELIGDTSFTDDVPSVLGGGQSLLLNTEFTLEGGVSEDEIDLSDNAGYVDLGNPDLLNFGTDNFTVASWMKVPEFLFQRGNIFSNGGDNGGGVRYVMGYLENGGRSIVLTTDDNATKRQAQADAFDWVVDDEEWHHVVAVKEDSELRVYIDGEFAAENLDVPEGYDLSGTDQQPAYIGVGADAGSGALEKYLQGWVDDVAVWNEALTEDQIATVMSGDFSEWISDGILGDYNDNGQLDAGDLDLQAAAIAANDLAYDLNNDGATNYADRQVWVKDLKSTWIGDANLDGVFDSGDFVVAFTAGKYETGDAAGWADGDFDGNLLFDSADFVASFIDGGYEAGPVAAVAAVPEPSSVLLILVGLLGVLRIRRK